MIPAFAERGYAATTIAAIPAVIEGHLHAGHAAAVPAPSAVPSDAHRTSGGGHVGSWNVDKAGYERVLRDFVTRLIA
jgi:hypothetical protein